MRQLRDECRLVLEAAQVEHQRAVDDAPDHRHRQCPQRGRSRGERAARAAADARVGWIATPALGSRSTGRAPLPIWLSQAVTPTS